MTTETLQESLHRIQSEPYVATLRHHRSWGPWAWSFELEVGLCSLGESWGPKRWYAWTREGTEKKARRVVARTERSERRNHPERPVRHPMVVNIIDPQGANA